MKTYLYYIPSHTKAPDIEGEIEAESKRQAAQTLTKKFDIDVETMMLRISCEHCAIASKRCRH